MDNFQQGLQNLLILWSSFNKTELSTSAIPSFLLIASAEMGDKSQLVCMTLATRYPATPILLGAITAFAFLNSLAVLFGSAIASWLPMHTVYATVALLFTAFGIHSLTIKANENDDEVVNKTGRSIFFTTFLLITIAEFADKTQLAVVALSSTANPIAIWTGATVALAVTSTLGVLAGKTILQKISITLLHKISGLLFLLLACFSAYQAYLSFQLFPQL